MAAGTESGAPDPRIAQGVKLHDQGRYAEAIDLFRAVLKDSNADLVARYELVMSLTASGDLAGCIAEARAGIALAERDAAMNGALHMALGNCLDATGDSQGAIAAFHRGLEAVPDDPQLSFNLAVSLAVSGRLDEARAAVERALAGWPAHPSSHRLLAIVHEKSGARIPALLAYLRFLSLEAEGPRALAAARSARKLLEQGVSTEKEGTTIRVGAGDGADDGTLAVELMLGLATAASRLPEEQDKPEAARVAGELASFLQMLAEGKGTLPGFAGKTHAPFLAALAKEGLAEVFGYAAFGALDLDGSRAWLAEHGAEVERLRTFVASHGSMAGPATVVYPKRPGASQ